jgi:negative regulator of flagellin synthesis FlgM
MKVSGNNNINVLKIYSDNQSKTAGRNDKPERKYDTVEISKEGMEIAKYAEAYSGVPDMRIEKIEEIKSRIQNGSYKVSSEELAKKILESIDEGSWRK